MKKLFTLMALSLTSVSIMAQSITLDLPNYGSWTPIIDTLKELNGQPTLATGANATWDISAIGYNAGVYSTQYVSSTNISLPGATFYVPLSFDLTPAVTYDVKAWEVINASGIISLGESMDQQTIDLSALTDPGDNLVFPAQTVPYSSPRTIIKFPATYNDNWSSNFRSVTNFNATIQSMLLNNVPAQRATNTVQHDTVIGWGRIRVKDANGTPSAYMNVLQVKTHIAQSDSFYVNGLPVDNSILSNLMMSQGMVTEFFSINYYRPGEVTPIVQREYTDATYAGTTTTYVHQNRLPDGTGVADIADENGISIYPNPVKNGFVSVHIENDISGAWTYELRNMMGQVVSSERITLRGSRATINLGTSNAPGIYYLQLNRNGEKISVKALSID